MALAHRSNIQKTDTVILSLDPGTNCTGYAVFTDGKLKKYGMIEPGSSLSLGKRILSIHRRVCSLIAAYEPPEPSRLIIVCEDQYSGQNKKTAMTLREATAVMRLAAAQYGVEFYLCTATTVKKAVTGNGKASKQDVKDSVVLKTGVPNDLKSDVTDAIAVGIAYLDGCERQQ